MFKYDDDDDHILFLLFLCVCEMRTLCMRSLHQTCDGRGQQPAGCIIVIIYLSHLLLLLMNALAFEIERLFNSRKLISPAWTVNIFKLGLLTSIWAFEHLIVSLTLLWHAYAVCRKCLRAIDAHGWKAERWWKNEYHSDGIKFEAMLDRIMGLHCSPAFK